MTCEYATFANTVFTGFLLFPQITADNCVEVERIAADLHLEDVQRNIGGRR